MTTITINVTDKIDAINPNIYGHFAEHLGRCIYDGIWVGEDSSIPNTGGFRNDVIEALKKLKPPVIRWPGGCFADDYHWQDGIGPRGQRPWRINIHWGEVIEANMPKPFDITASGPSFGITIPPASIVVATVMLL